LEWMDNLKKISITIASKREDERNTVATLLTEHDDFSISSIVADNFGLVNSAMKLRPNVIVMDFRLENIDTIRLAPIIKRNSPETELIVMCSPKERVAVDRVLRAGVSGYLLRQQDFAYLPLSVRCVSYGGLYLSEEIKKQAFNCFTPQSLAAQGMGKAFPSDISAARSKFTPMELQIFHGIILGYSDSEIASGLSISVGTLRNYVCLTKKKIGLQNRTQIGIYALSCGLIAWEADFIGAKK